MLDQGTVDVAFIWAPVAGWLNATAYGEKYQIRTTAGEGLSWSTAIGFAKTSTGLRDDVNVVLPSLQEDIDRLFVKYGVPSDARVKFGELGHPTAIADAEPKEPVTVGESAGDSKAAEVKVTASGGASAGRELFNGTCAHCHRA